jgi:hypothetical protein
MKTATSRSNFLPMILVALGLAGAATSLFGNPLSGGAGAARALPESQVQALCAMAKQLGSAVDRSAREQAERLRRETGCRTA